MAQDPLEELKRLRSSAAGPSVDPLEELKRLRNVLKDTATPVIMEDDPFAMQRPRRGTGQLDPVRIEAKAPNKFEMAAAKLRPPVGNDKDLTGKQRMQVERAQAFRGYTEDVAAQVAGQPERTFYRAATGLSKFINPKGTAELSEKMRKVEEATKPKTGLGKGARVASEIAQYLPLGMVGGTVLAGLESSASPEASLANIMSNKLGAGDIGDPRIRAALDMALIPLIGKTVGAAVPYVAQGAGKAVGGARNLTNALDFGSGMSRGIAEGAVEAAEAATPSLRTVGPTPAQTQRAAAARAAYDKELADEARGLIAGMGYEIKAPGPARRRPASKMPSDAEVAASNADVEQYLMGRDEAAAWKMIRENAVGSPERLKAVDRQIKALMEARKRAGIVTPVKTGRQTVSPSPTQAPLGASPAGARAAAALPDEVQALVGQSMATPLEAALEEGASVVAKRRGRPPKAPPTPEELAAQAALPPKKRGRPRKTEAEQPALEIPEAAAGEDPSRLSSAFATAPAGAIGGAMSGEEGDTQSTITRGVLGALAAGAGGAALYKMFPKAGAAAKAVKEIPEIYAPRAATLAEQFDPATYTNVARFSENPRVQDRLLAATEEMVRAKDVPLRTAAGRLQIPETLNEVRQRVAADMGIDVADVAIKTKAGERIGRDDILRVKTALDMAMDEETALALKLKNQDFGSVGMTKQEFAAEERLLRTSLARVEADKRALMEVFSSQRTSTARDLNALKAASLRNFDPAAWEIQLERYAKRPLTQEERIAARAAAAERNADKLVKLGNDVKKSTFGEKIGAYFQANLLTSPATQVANVGGNVTEAAMEIAKDAPATLIDRLLSIKTGIRTKDFNPKATMDASFKGVADGVKQYGSVMRGEALPNQALTDMPRQVNFDSPILDAYVKGVLRSLSATDNVFRKMALYRANAEQARVIAKAEKLLPSSDEYAKRVQELIANPTVEMEANAIAAADFATFQTDSKLARAASSLSNAGGGAGKLLFPFTRTPANIVMQTGYHYTPLALAGELKNMSKLLLSKRPESLAEKQALVRIQRQISENLGRASVGTAALALGYKLAERGLMTGFFPEDQRTRDEWEQQGKLEGAAKVGGMWTQVNRLSPLGNLMQIGAAMHEARKTPGETLLEQGKTLLATGTAPLRTVAELPMVSNVKDLIEMGTHFGQEEFVDAGAQIAARTATGLVPLSSLIRASGRAIDRTQRETKGTTPLGTIGNEILAQVPGFSKTLPEKVDPLGTVLRREGSPLSAIFSPITMRTALTDANPLRAEMARTGAVAGRIKREEGETGQQFAEREKMTGGAIATVMSAISQTPGYQQLSAMPTDSLRRLLEQSGQNTSKISDDKIRARVQGYLLEQAMEQTKTLIAEERARLRAVPSSAKALVRSITR